MGMCTDPEWPLWVQARDSSVDCVQRQQPWRRELDCFGLEAGHEAPSLCMATSSCAARSAARAPAPACGCSRACPAPRTLLLGAPPATAAVIQRPHYDSRVLLLADGSNYPLPFSRRRATAAAARLRSPPQPGLPRQAKKTS